MHDDGSPYQPPVNSTQHAARADLEISNSAIVTSSLLILPIVGGIAGFGGYILAASMLDHRDTTTETILPYGQQAGLISLPICTIISAAIGLGLALAVVRQYSTSILLLLIVSLTGWAINNSFWNNQIAMHGRDPSEAVLYYPTLACSGLAFSTAALIAFVAFAAKRKRST